MNNCSSYFSSFQLQHDQNDPTGIACLTYLVAQAIECGPASRGVLSSSGRNSDGGVGGRGGGSSDTGYAALALLFKRHVTPFVWRQYHKWVVMTKVGCVQSQQEM
jgi:hypothetical protein